MAIIHPNFALGHLPVVTVGPKCIKKKHVRSLLNAGIVEDLIVQTAKNVWPAPIVWVLPPRYNCWCIAEAARAESIAATRQGSEEVNMMPEVVEEEKEMIIDPQTTPTNPKIIGTSEEIKKSLDENDCQRL
ncbi:hypothetical protein K3495_g1862 [Podosphaera aphanis]|nr:hypothetical protein K3495_g1862 [Podosphaera aphanis]